MNKKTIYILRHGETDYNRNGIVQGSGVDSSLNDWGRKQAEAFYEHYKEIKFEVVCTSALQRTHQTVKSFIDKNILWEQWPEINEINWGIHEGQKSKPWMVNEYKRVTTDWTNGNYDARVEEGESARELADRLRIFIEQLKSRPESLILVCTHGRTMRCFLSLLKQQEIKGMQSNPHSNTGLNKVVWDGEKFDVQLENDTQHLEKLTLEHES